jgi:hypothetical protein
MESKNPSNADDWITHTTRKKPWTKFLNGQTDSGIQISIEKTKAAKKTAIAPGPRLDI